MAAIVARILLLARHHPRSCTLVARGFFSCNFGGSYLAAAIFSDGAIRPMDWTAGDYPSYGFYGRAVQGPQEDWTLRALARKLLAIGKGQLGCFVVGTLRSPA